MARTVWFYRDYVRLYGGHVKHSHYFDHVRRMQGFEPRITFSGPPANESLARERRWLWPPDAGAAAEGWEPEEGDVLFLAGVDWRYLNESALSNLPNPRVNLVQGLRHTVEGAELQRYLAEPAIRICVSEEVADAIVATGRSRGPVLTIPNGTDITPFEPAENGSPVAFEARAPAVVILGYKRPNLAGVLAARLEAQGVDHRHVTDFLDRGKYLDLLAASRVAVCLPKTEEGFYLPALEAMASGCLVVTLDCVGNRGFCHHELSCLVAEPKPGSLAAAVTRALAMPAPERGRMHRQARAVAARHSLEAERTRFHAVLRDVNRLWRDATTMAVPARPMPNAAAQTEPEASLRGCPTR